MQKNNLIDKYSFKELLEDRDFINFVKQPTPTKHVFWQKLLDEGRVNKEDMDWASSLILLAQGKQELPATDDVDQMWQTILEKNKKNQHKRFFGLFTGLSILAAVLVGVGLILGQQVPSENEKEIELEAVYSSLIDQPLPVSSEIIISTKANGITALNNNAKVKYDTNGSVKIDQQRILTETIIEDKKGQDHISLDQIMVPHGKHSTLYLSDGSVLCINANTRVIYPAIFTEKERVIYVEGEVYIDVFPNKDRPFRIRTNQFDVQVLGTSFNLRAYKNTNQSIVLVKGQVKVSRAQNTDLHIQANQLLEWSEDMLPIIKTVDVNPYIAWKDGLQMYSSSNLGYILDGLSAYYGIKIHYKESVAQLKFSGKLELKDQLDPVIRGIAQSTAHQCKYINGAYYID